MIGRAKIYCGKSGAAQVAVTHDVNLLLTLKSLLGHQNRGVNGACCVACNEKALFAR